MLKKIVLKINNDSGSPQHYYHFLLGFLLPLINTIFITFKGSEDTHFYVRSCGPMDRHLNSLKIPNLIVVSLEEYSICLENNEFKKFEVYGYDNPSLYIKPHFTSAVNLIKSRFCLVDCIPKAKGHILFVNRSLDLFYNSTQSEIQTSGVQRRSLPNFQSIVIDFKNIGLEVTTAVFEFKNLYDQIKLVMNADIIIAQHGASLANIIFAREGTKIIEIITEEFVSKSIFSKLAHQMNLDYRHVIQESIHADVEANQIISKLELSI